MSIGMFIAGCIGGSKEKNDSGMEGRMGVERKEESKKKTI